MSVPTMYTFSLISSLLLRVSRVQARGLK
jgi:hypothetical protein